MQKRITLFASVIILALLTNASFAQEPTKRTKQQNLPTAATTNPVVGSGTAGQITKWTGVTGSNTFTVGNANITEDKFGNIGIGTTMPTSLLTVQGMIETTMGGYKFPDGTIQTTAFDPNHVVRSLNGLTGNVTLAAGANVTITPSGNTLTIASPNSLTSVAHDATLTGGGTSGSPLGVANGGIGNAQLANNAVTYSKIASGQVVAEINHLTDSVTLAAGANITITPSGNTLTFASPAGPIKAYNGVENIGVSIKTPGADVISKEVPAGSYLISFVMGVENIDDDPQTVGCNLNPENLLPAQSIRLGGLGDLAQGIMVLHGLVTFATTTTIKVHCSGFFVIAETPVLTLLKVDSIQ